MNNVLYSHQFGFRRNNSTNHALLNLTQKIMDALDKGEYACGIFIDLQKAFDTVDHEILFKKLYQYVIRGTTLSLFKSYLTNRSQFVTINGVSSNQIGIKHGVPQGSVLGPLLFLIYI
jgi:retron-type reverse transcriptase